MKWTDFKRAVIGCTLGLGGLALFFLIFFACIEAANDPHEYDVTYIYTWQQYGDVMVMNQSPIFSHKADCSYCRTNQPTQ
jgi:hypothetical protein